MVLFPSRYSDETRAKIAKYAFQHGCKAASVYSRKLGTTVSRSSIHSMQQSYLKYRKEVDSDDDVASLPPKKRGRPSLLRGFEYQLRMYLLKIREQGGYIVTASVVVAAARGILLSYSPTQLAEFGGHIVLTSSWAYHFLKRMSFVRRKASTAKSKQKPQDFAELKKAFLADVVSVVTMEEIPPELVLTCWTMEQVGAKRVEIAGVNEKRQITAVLCGSLTGDYLPMQLIYQGKTNRCHPVFDFLKDWDVTHSPKHWSTENMMLGYIKEIIVPYVDSTRDFLGQDSTQSALVIINNFKGQVTESVNLLLEANNIHVCLLPPNTTDLPVNKPVKDFLRKKFESWYADEVAKQLHDDASSETAEIQPVDLSFAAVKVLSAKRLVEVGEYLSENPQFIVNGFRRAGISPALDGRSDEDLEEDQDSEENEEDPEESKDDSEESEGDSEELR